MHLPSFLPTILLLLSTLTTQSLALRPTYSHSHSHLHRHLPRSRPIRPSHAHNTRLFGSEFALASIPTYTSYLLSVQANFAAATKAKIFPVPRAAFSSLEREEYLINQLVLERMICGIEKVRNPDWEADWGYGDSLYGQTSSYGWNSRSAPYSRDGRAPSFGRDLWRNVREEERELGNEIETVKKEVEWGLRGFKKDEKKNKRAVKDKEVEKEDEEDERKYDDNEVRVGAGGITSEGVLMMMTAETKMVCEVDRKTGGALLAERTWKRVDTKRRERGV